MNQHSPLKKIVQFNNFRLVYKYDKDKPTQMTKEQIDKYSNNLLKYFVKTD